MLLLATIGAVILSSASGTRSLQQFSVANAPAADLISAGLTAIQSDPNGTATALANRTAHALTLASAANDRHWYVLLLLCSQAKVKSLGMPWVGEA